MTIEGEGLEDEEKFTYLGIPIYKSGGTDEDIVRNYKAHQDFAMLKPE